MPMTGILIRRGSFETHRQGKALKMDGRRREDGCVDSGNTKHHSK